MKKREWLEIGEIKIMGNEFILDVIRRKLYLEVAEEYDEAFEKQVYGCAGFLGTLAISGVMYCCDQRNLATASLIASSVPLAICLKNTLKKQKIKAEVEKKVQAEYKKLLDSIAGETKGYSYSDITAGGRAFISRVEELQNYILGFKYVGYEEDIASLSHIVESYREDILTNGLAKYSGYYEEALKTVEQNAINGATLMALQAEEEPAMSGR